MTYLPAILPRPRRVTISQVAEVAGVARATAAFVISGRAPELRIAQKAIDRVNAVAKKLGYVPNQLARGMITGRSHVVGVILGGVWGKFGQYVIEAVREVLDAQGYLPFLTIHSWSEHREDVTTSVKPTAARDPDFRNGGLVGVVGTRAPGVMVELLTSSYGMALGRYETNKLPLSER